MRVLRNIWQQVRVVARAKGDWMEFPRWLIRRPLIAAGIGASEMAETLSARVDYELKLLAQSMVASMVGCEFCLDVSAALAQTAHVDRDKLLDLHRFEQSSAFDETERLVLRLTTLLTETPVHPVPSELRDELIRRLGKAGFVEISAAIAHEHQRTRLYLALGIRPAKFAPDDACRIPLP